MFKTKKALRRELEIEREMNRDSAILMAKCANKLLDEPPNNHEHEFVGKLLARRAAELAP